MYCSSKLLLVFMTIVSLSGVYSVRNSYRNYDVPHNDRPEDEVINIGNGVNKNNFVILDQGPDNTGAPYQNTRSKTHHDTQNNRFNDEQPRQGSSTTNIGNGHNNHNKVYFTNGDRGTGFSSQNDPDGWSNQGTTFKRKHNDGEDVYNVGYGKNNQNKFTVDGTPLQPDCYGSRCDDIKIYHRVSSAGKTYKTFTLFFSLLSIFNLILL